MTPKPSPSDQPVKLEPQVSIGFVNGVSVDLNDLIMESFSDANDSESDVRSRSSSRSRRSNTNSAYSSRSSRKVIGNENNKG